jgi:hypothetical protein
MEGAAGYAAIWRNLILPAMAFMLNWPNRFLVKIEDSLLAKTGNEGGRVGDAMTYLLSVPELLDFALPFMKAVEPDPCADCLEERCERHNPRLVGN